MTSLRPTGDRARKRGFTLRFAMGEGERPTSFACFASLQDDIAMNSQAIFGYLDHAGTSWIFVALSVLATGVAIDRAVGAARTRDPEVSALV